MQNQPSDGGKSEAPGSPTAPSVRVLWRNTLTVGGGIATILIALFIVGFLVVDLVSTQRSPYVGLFTFLVFPVLAVFSMLLTLIGLVHARRRLKRRFGSTNGYQYYPRIDLGNSRHRRYLAVIIGVVALALPTIGVVSYQGYHYTDSNQFCGNVCHTVMQPQFTAYQQSPHAHVACSECHIGSGASWYVKSKLSGIRQVFAVALNSYPRPIPPAIQELRPATDTCRECHWPAKFFGDQLVTIEHFASDEANTRSKVRMLLKTGGSDPSTGPPSGIHWHMALGFTIEYIARDKFLQDIPWVRMTDRSTERQAVYRSDGLSSHDPPPEGIHRTVDCMDCHNRPTHVFRSPDRAVDAALNVHASLQTLPSAKRETVAALAKKYATKDEGLAQVTNAVAGFYEREHPDVWRQRKTDVDQLVNVAREIYSTNFFPEMNVSWRTYPDNIGHKIYPGCFRCHDGEHKDDKGASIRSDCTTCHEFLQPGTGDGAAAKTVGIGGFNHPLKLEGMHAKMRCNNCHTGAEPPDPTCAGCHTTVAQFRDGTLPALKEYGISADPMAANVQCADCHDLSKPRTVEAMNEKCMDCHDDEKERFGGMVASWRRETQQILDSLSKSPDAHAKDMLQLLQQVGPQHNMDAARKVVQRLNSGAIGDAR